MKKTPDRVYLKIEDSAYPSLNFDVDGMTGGEFEQYMADSETIYPVQIINYDWKKESK